MSEPKEDAHDPTGDGPTLRPVRAHIRVRRIDVASVTVRFTDGSEHTVENKDYTRLMAFRANENATGTREVALGETPERRWVEFDVSWSVEMEKDAKGRWWLPT